MEDLKRVALLGTERTELPDIIEEIEANGVAVQSKDDAETLLNALAVYVQTRKVGSLANDFDGEMPEVNLKSNAYFLNSTSAEHLNKILVDNNYRKILQEFAHNAYENGFVIPPELLPVVFDWCIKDKKVAKYLSPVLGESGKWLAKYNEEWQAVIPTENSWSSKDNEKRLAYFKALRGENPEKARQLLEDSMGEIDIKQLGAFVESLAINLSTKDEQFLEKCLEIDKLKPKAIALLKENGDSEFTHRWIKRAIDSIKWDGERLKMVLPTEIDDTLMKDAQSKPKAISSDYDALVLSNTPPSFWEEAFSKTPESILPIFIKANLNSSLYKSAFKAVIASVITYHDEQWSVSLLDNYQDKSDFSKKEFRQLIDILSKEAFNDLAVRLLKSDTQIKHLKARALSFFSRKGTEKTTEDRLFEAESFLTRLLVENSQLWSKELTKLVIDRLLSYWNDEWKWRKYNAGIREIVAAAHWKVDAMYYNDDIVPAESWDYTDRFLELFFERWKFRKEMVVALNNVPEM